MPNRRQAEAFRSSERIPESESTRPCRDGASEDHARRLVEFARRIDAMVWTLARTRRSGTGGTDHDK